MGYYVYITKYYVTMKTEPKPDVSPHSKYFIYIAILFVVVLMISNTVGIKIIQIGSLPLAGGVFIFPISYIFGDILTEVYGYKASRKIIWSGFFSIIFMAFCYWLTKVLPPAPFFRRCWCSSPTALTHFRRC